MANANAILRDGAETLIPEQVSKEIVQGVTEGSAALKMFRKLPNMTSKKTKVPVLDMLPIAYFVDGDNGTKKTTKMEWANKYITAEEIAVIVPIPEAVLDDAEYDIFGQIKPRLIEAFHKKIDGAVFFDVEKPASWRKGLYETAKAAGSIVVKTADVYKDIMGEDGVIAKIESSGYIPTGAAGAIKLRSVLRGIKDNDGSPIFKRDMQSSTRYALDGCPIEFPKNGEFDSKKALIIMGDFSQAVYSIRQDITMKVFTEGVVQDPTTKEIVYNLMQNDMVALRAVMRLGWQLPNPVNLLEPDNDKRCPFAVYAPDGTVVGG